MNLHNTGFGRLIIGIFLSLIAIANSLNGQTIEQTMVLEPGWNAIYLEVEPADTSMDAVFQGLPIESVWTFVDKETPIDFIEDPDELPWNNPGWRRYFPDNELITTLHAVMVNTPYLVKLISDTSTDFTISGRPSFQPSEWVANSFNFRGFPINPEGNITFGDYFAPSPAHSGQPIYRLDSATGNWSQVAASDTMASGEAYWVFCQGNSDFIAPIHLELQSGDGLEFGRDLSNLGLTLTNLSGGVASALLEVLPANADPPLSYQERDPETLDLLWRNLLQSASVFLVGITPTIRRIAIRRQDMAGTDYETVLQVSDPSGIRYLLPVHAEKLAPIAAASSIRSARSSNIAARSNNLCGLWVGSVVVDAVTEVHGGIIGNRVINAIDLPSWLTLNTNDDGTASLTGLPGSEDTGSHNVVLQVVDAAGATSEQSFTIAVEEANDPPAFTTEPLSVITPGSHSNTVGFEDPNSSDTVTFSAPVLPAWLTATDQGDGTATLAGTVTTADLGSYPVTLQLSDTKDIIQQPFTIHVVHELSAPTFRSNPQTLAAENSDYLYSINTHAPRRGLLFDGVDDYVEVQGRFAEHEFTIEFWIATDDTTHAGTIIHYYSDLSTLADGTLIQDARALKVSIQDSLRNTGVAINDANWHHLALVWQAGTSATEDNGFLNLYVDGELSYSDPAVFAELPLSGTLIFGQQRNTDGSFVADKAFSGLLDDIRIWDRARSAAEIRAGIDAQLANNEEGLVANWQFLEGTGDVAASSVTLPGIDMTGQLFGPVWAYPFSEVSETVHASRAIGAANLPNWLIFADNGNGTAILSGRPGSADIGNHALELTVSDFNGIATSQSFTIQVQEANASPEIVSEPPVFVSPSTEYNYYVEANDADTDDVLTFELTAAPPWLTLSLVNDRLARLSGTAAGADLGDHAVTLTVRDGLDDDTQNFILTVTEQDIAPSFTSTQEGGEVPLGEIFLYEISTDFKPHAIRFDGVDDSIDLGRDPEEISNLETITVEAWIKLDAFGTMRILEKEGEWALHVQENFVRWQIEGGTSGVDSQILALGTWYHVAATHDRTTATLYLNGESQGTAANPAIPDSPYHLTLGAQRIGGAVESTENFAGLIDEVRIWNNVRSQEQISATKDTRLRGVEDGLLLYLPMDEGSGPFTKNSSTLAKNPSRIDRTAGSVEGSKADEEFWQVAIEGPSSSTVTAFDFAGDDTAVLVPVHRFPGGSEFTLEVWLRAPADATGNGIISYATLDPVTTNTEDNMILLFNETNLTLWVNGAQLQSGLSINDDTWHHVAVSWQSSDGTAIFYIDGTAEFQGTLEQSVIVPDGGFVVLGQEQDDFGGGFQASQAYPGLMYDVRIWNRVRSTSEIMADMNTNLVGAEPGLAIHFPLQEGAGRIAGNNTSIKELDGLLVSGSEWVLPVSDPALVNEADRTLEAPGLPDWLQLIDNGDGTAALSGAPTAKDSGAHDIVLQVRNALGVGATQSFTLTVPEVQRPQFTSTPIPEVTQGDDYLYAIEVIHSTPGIDMDITAETIPNWLTLNDNGNGTATLSGTPSAADVGDVETILVATDENGQSQTQEFTVIVMAIVVPVAFASTPVIVGTEDESYLYVIATTGPNTPGAITASSLPAWLTLVDINDGTALLRGTPEDNDIGDHAITLNVVHANGSAAVQEFTINIANLNDRPHFSGRPITTAVVDVTYDYTVTTVDLDPGDSLTLTAQVLPDWLSFVDLGNGSGVVSGTPSSANLGQHGVKFIVVDDAGEASTQFFTITVFETGPTFSSAPVIKAAENVAYQYLIATDGIDGVDTRTNPTPTGSEFNLRLLVHLDKNNNLRFLKEVIQLWEDGDEDAGTPGRYVLITDDDIIPEFKGAGLRDGQLVGRRISTIGIEFPGQFLDMSGSLAPGNQIETGSFTLDSDFPTNPYRHKLHPDHDNLDTDFSTPKQEAFDITREIRMNIGAEPADLNTSDYGYNTLGGTYTETISGVHQSQIVVSGSFTLQRVSTTDELNAGR